MAAEFHVRDLVRRRVDGVLMVIVDIGRLNRGEWQCAWMDGHLRRTDEFTKYEIEHHEPNTIDLKATRVEDLAQLVRPQ